MRSTSPRAALQAASLCLAFLSQAGAEETKNTASNAELKSPKDLCTALIDATRRGDSEFVRNHMTGMDGRCIVVASGQERPRARKAIAWCPSASKVAPGSSTPGPT
jgi:hypothetical protein